MKGKFYKAIVGVMLIGLLGTGLVRLSAENDRALVRSMIGAANVKRDGQTTPLKVGSIIKDSDIIQTGRQSQVTVFYKGVEIRLMGETNATLTSLTDMKKEASVTVTKGFGWFNVKDPTKRGFTAQTPTAVAGVRGTKFAIGSDENGTTSCVCEGTVVTKAASGGEESTVTAGGSHAYNAAGAMANHDFKKYFKKLKVDRSFQQEILRDAKLNNCKTCHRMTNIATDNTRDPENY